MHIRLGEGQIRTFEVQPTRYGPLDVVVVNERASLHVRWQCFCLMSL